jgi:hypothetical protein
VILRSSLSCFSAEIERLVSKAFDPRETPSVVALVSISKSENLEKDMFDPRAHQRGSLFADPPKSDNFFDLS